MEFFSYLAAFLLVKRLQKFLAFSPLRAKWMSQLTLASWVVVGICISAIIYLHSGWPSILGGALLLGAIWFADNEADFQPFNSFIKAHLPLGAASILAGLTEVVAPKFYDKYDNFFDFAIIAGFVWIFARWATTKKQREEINLVNQQNIQLDKLVAARTAELTQQKNELQQTLDLLQTTQQQLIQSEKLASLGELTAGIAHEIQNPLNFVNNFSEVSMELVDEMEEELAKGDTEEAIAIAADIKQNLEKIIHHGKRADGIVKGMLQHSRASSNTKEATDINKLADEYLRLAYHGLRAKDKSFNAEMITHLDETLPMANVVPQDIGRVLLNLFTNAFYAVQEKQKTAATAYKPTITLSTKSIAAPGPKGSQNIEITVQDNGTGIPDSVKEKIMQPFFTTKPTGQGTGLGLSLSHDIVVKGHGGAINIDTKEGEFTKFIVTIPV
ncbi:ATP-binding protein [Mucilaginibacter sp.]|uniref:sensor histidine kinase n=1 Tax=Mucilaginibacter sp. TaxID=1882438 RepID=UPI00284E11CC|nr:ATP-binding protein [Mucilaginibacter sp.]MDR3695245.1 ATP-binding protein [Mucilaginibacter sp.]